jgi:hypothetical protein
MTLSLYVCTMIDDCIMQTAFESHISFIEFQWWFETRLA